MRERLRRRSDEQDGFTLIELLVVVIIIGLLAAVVIPAFLGQRNKANNAAAKSLVRHGATAMEAYFTAGNTYVGANATNLRAIEPNIAWTTGAAAASLNRVKFSLLSVSRYALESTSKSGTTFVYTKTLTAASGSTVRRTCVPATACPAAGW